MLDGARTVVLVEIGDGQQQFALSALCCGGVAVHEHGVRLDGTCVVAHLAVAFSHAEQCRRHECRLREPCYHVGEGLYLAVVVAAQTFHHSLLVDGIVAGFGVGVERLFVGGGGSGEVGGVILRIGQTVVGVGHESLVGSCSGI